MGCDRKGAGGGGLRRWCGVGGENGGQDLVNLPPRGQTGGGGEIRPVRRCFCKRCQLDALGEWAAEEKRIPSSGDLSESDDWSEEPKQ
ncbi:DNA gyrase inhibitor YacG [Escherichia coli]|nr:DNA gyrase inhibitor YacG [Escherichia coli]